jgi:hypothetical protein
MSFSNAPKERVMKVGDYVEVDTLSGSRIGQIFEMYGTGKNLHVRVHFSLHDVDGSILLNENGEEDIRLFPYRASEVRTVTQALQPS